MSWPTRKETVQTTLVVFAFVVVMALFLFAVDTTLAWLVKLADRARAGDERQEVVCRSRLFRLREERACAL